MRTIHRINIDTQSNLLIEEAIKSLYGGREYYELLEAKKLDPVGEEDEDVDNDGDSDESDEYIKNRRKRIAQAIKEAKCEEDEDLKESTHAQRSRLAKRARRVRVKNQN